jgi:hypothetical protein
MPKPRADGEENVAQNGYHYRKVDGKWVLIHHIIAEEQLGRPLRPSEGAYFKDGDRDNLDPGNIGVRRKGSAKLRSRLAAVEARIRELQVERDDLIKELEE